MIQTPILADESVDYQIIEILRAEGFPIEAIVEQNPGISDDDVLFHASQNRMFLLTEDKDFGELAIRLRKPHYGILLLRFMELDVIVKASLTKMALIENIEKMIGNFSVLDERKLRIREIHK